MNLIARLIIINPLYIGFRHSTFFSRFEQYYLLTLHPLDA
jgi:hypothetical protein